MNCILRYYLDNLWPPGIRAKINKLQFLPWIFFNLTPRCCQAEWENKAEAPPGKLDFCGRFFAPGIDAIWRQHRTIMYQTENRLADGRCAESVQLAPNMVGGRAPPLKRSGFFCIYFWSRRTFWSNYFEKRGADESSQFGEFWHVKLVCEFLQTSWDLIISSPKQVFSIFI